MRRRCFSGNVSPAKSTHRSELKSRPSRSPRSDSWTSAVGTAAYNELDALWIGKPYRISGANRYETAAEVAEIGFTGLGMLYSRPAIATGENFPDALAGGVLQGSDYCVMLLTPSGSLHPEAAAALTKHKDSIYELRYLGGTSALAPAVRTSSAALLH